MIEFIIYFLQSTSINGVGAVRAANRRVKELLCRGGVAFCGGWDGLEKKTNTVVTLEVYERVGGNREALDTLFGKEQQKDRGWIKSEWRYGSVVRVARKKTFLCQKEERRKEMVLECGGGRALEQMASWYFGSVSKMYQMVGSDNLEIMVIYGTPVFRGWGATVFSGKFPQWLVVFSYVHMTPWMMLYTRSFVHLWSPPVLLVLFIFFCFLTPCLYIILFSVLHHALLVLSTIDTKGVVVVSISHVFVHQLGEYKQ